MSSWSRLQAGDQKEKMPNERLVSLWLWGHLGAGCLIYALRSWMLMLSEASSASVFFALQSL